MPLIVGIHFGIPEFPMKIFSDVQILPYNDLDLLSSLQSSGCTWQLHMGRHYSAGSTDTTFLLLSLCPNETLVFTGMIRCFTKLK